uniref:retention module-containing protein n=1 Tax=Shewanella sp. UCD-KL12 TaxID=1917163 RepID=UPI0015C3C172
MGVSVAEQDAVVTNLVGQLKAKDEQGNIRDVTIGDLIKNGEQLIFSPSSQFILQMADGTILTEINLAEPIPDSSLGAIPEITATPEFATAPVSADAEIAALQAQILAGDDPTAGLPETAAGTAAGGGGNEGGTDFVSLGRTGDETLAGAGHDTEGFDATADPAEDPLILTEEVANLPTLGASTVTLLEANLPQGSNPIAAAISQSGGLIVDAEAGIASLSVGGIDIFSAGLFVGPITITTANGVLTLTGFDPVSGILSYNFTLNSALDNSALDTISQTFTALVTDLVGNTSASTITVNIVDDSPTGVDDTNTVSENGEVSVPITGNVLLNDTQGADSAVVSQITSSDGTTLAVSGTTSISGSFGFLDISADGSYSYLLDNSLENIQALAEGEEVTEIFTYQLTDADGDSVLVTLSITITGTNDVPIVVIEDPDGPDGPILADDEGLVIEAGNEDDGTVVPGVTNATGTLAPADVDNGAVLTWSGNSDGLFGSLTIDPVTGEWSYNLDNSLADSLAEGTSAEDIFIVTVTDEFGASTTQQITITVQGTNDSPIITSSAADATGSLSELESGEPFTTIQTATGTLTATDVDTGAVLSWSGDADSFYGSFTIDSDTGQWVYTLDNLAADSLAEGEIVQEEFLVTVTDEFGATDTQIVTINIVGTNEASILVDDFNTIDEDTVATGNVLDNDSDTDDVLTVATFNVEGNTHDAGSTVELEDGTLTLNSDGTYTFTPDANFNGNVPIVTYTTNTGETATLTIIVEPVNDAPDALNNSYDLSEGGFTSGNIITDNTGSGIDSDIDGGPLSITHINGVAVVFNNGVAIIPIGDGSLTINQDGSFTYSHNGEEPAATSFTYTINDGLGGTDTATVFLNISNVNDGPFAEDDSFTVDEGALLGGNVITHIDNNDGLQDSDGGDGGTLTITHVDGVLLVFDQDGWSQDFSVGNGTLRIKADGTFEYQHDGSDPEQTPPTFDYTLSDGVDSDDATVTITINAVNDGPFAEDDSFTVDEGALLGGNVITHIDNNDGLQDSDGGDGGTLTVTHVDGVLLVFDQDGWSQDFSVGNGTLRIKADGTFEYQHDGSDPEQTPPTFDYTLSDGVDSD